MPSGYAQGHSAAVVASHASRTVESAASFLLPHIQPQSIILDLGCGPGTITRGFCAHVPQGQVIGMDASESVISQARESAASEQDKYPNLTFRVGDITAGDLPFEDNSIDVVYTSQTLYHIPSPVAVMKEALRVLKPGGMLAMRESDTLLWHPLNPGVEAYSRVISRFVPSGAQGVGTGRRLHTWAAQAGFERSKMQVGTGGTCYSNAGQGKETARWWADVHIARLKGDVGKKLVEDMRLVNTQKEVDDMIQGLELWGQDEDAWWAALQGEVICRK